MGQVDYHKQKKEKDKTGRTSVFSHTTHQQSQTASSELINKNVLKQSVFNPFVNSNYGKDERYWKFQVVM